MFDTLTVNPASGSEIASRLVMAMACAATMFTLAVTPAIAAPAKATSQASCKAVSAQAATFARVQLGVTTQC